MQRTERAQPLRRRSGRAAGSSRPRRWMARPALANGDSFGNGLSFILGGVLAGLMRRKTLVTNDSGGAPAGPAP